MGLEAHCMQCCFELMTVMRNVYTHVLLQGMLNIVGSGHTAVRDFFPLHEEISPADLQHYGTEPTETHEQQADDSTYGHHTYVPNVYCPFPEAELDVIKQRINPLQNNEHDPDALLLFADLVTSIHLNGRK